VKKIIFLTLSLSVMPCIGADAAFYCPSDITCNFPDPEDMTKIDCPIPNGWILHAKTIGGSPQVGSSSKFLFTNAQSYPDEPSANCNFAFNNGKNGFYVISLGTYQYLAPKDNSGTAWITNGNMSYCYGIAVNDLQPNDPTKCPLLPLN
jgi:hypothetical protein